MCESVSLAHVSRAVVLANALDSDRFDVYIACDPRYEWIVGEAPEAKFYPLTSIAPDFFRVRVDLRIGTHSLTTARSYFRDELDLYEAVSPDLVIADLRYTASTSASVAGIASAILVNAYWSPYRSLAIPPMPSLEATMPVRRPAPKPVRAVRRAMRAASRLRKRRQTETEPEDIEAFNILRAEVDLAPFDDYPQLMTGGAHVLYAEPPGIVTMAPMPPEHRFIGAVVWSPRVDDVAWWSSIPDDRPMIYVGMGSTGELSRLQDLVTRLAEAEATIVVSTAGRGGVDISAPNVVVAEMVPGALLCDRASLVICSGGTGTGYQAIQGGTPVIALWSNEDQYLSSKVLESHHAAIAHGPQDPVDAIMQSVVTLLNDPSFASAAERLSTIFAAVDTRNEFVAAVEDILR